MRWGWHLLRRDLRLWPQELLANVIAASPLVPRPLRYLIYRVMGLKVLTLNVYPRCRIVGHRLDVGAGTMINSECYFDATGGIEIGARSHLGMRVTIATTAHDPGYIDRIGPVTEAPVVIGDDVWIGACCTILPGARVGPRTLVAAGAVITGACDADAVYAGVPARKVRDRNVERTRGQEAGT
jgi:maltose O-acetyltransferase